jgi:hypothetical protein
VPPEQAVDRLIKACARRLVEATATVRRQNDLQDTPVIVLPSGHGHRHRHAGAEQGQ